MMKRLTRQLERVQRPRGVWFSAGVLAFIGIAALAVYQSLGGSLLNSNVQQELASYYVNAGDCGPANWQGVTWQADQSYSPGSWGHVGDWNATSWDYGAVTGVDGDDQGLHRCRAWGSAFAYQFDVPNGEYRVKLRFVEPMVHAGERLFDVAAEGQTVLDNFDIAAEAGGRYIAIEREFNAVVEDGQLNVEFTGGQGGSDPSALFEAIAVEAISVAAPPAEEPPAEEPPTEEPPAEQPPTEVPPVEEPPVEEPPAEEPPPPMAGPVALFVNAGECGPVNWQGVEWADDQPYTPGGWGFVGADYNPIPPDQVAPVVDQNGNSLDDAGQQLHRCQVYGADFGYHFDIPSGDYVVSLRFAEPLRLPGERWFDVMIEGQPALDNFDVAAEAGATSRVVEKIFPVTVVDNKLEIAFVGNQENASDPNAFVQAIAVISQELWVEPTPVPPTEVPPTEVPPTEEPPTDEVPTEEPTVEAPTEEPTVEVPTEEPTVEVPTDEPTAVPTEEPTEEPAAPDYAQYVNVGQCSDVQWQSVTWADDKAYQTGGWGYFGSDYVAREAGQAWVTDGSGKRLDANGQELYRCRAYGTDFGYRFDVPNGEYTVTLHFVEALYSNRGARRFDVSIEGQKALDDFDILAEAGGKAIVMQRAFIVTVTDGQLEILFTLGSGASDTKPIVSALSVTGSGAPGQPSEPPPTPTEVPPPTDMPPTETPIPPTATEAPVEEPTPEVTEEPTPEPTEEPTPEPDPGEPAAPDYGQYVNVGACSDVQWQGISWVDDRAYQQGGWGYFGSDYVAKEPGQAYVTDGSGNQLDTNGQYLHRCRSYGTNFGYRFDVPDGEYTVGLRFVEPLYFNAGARRFDVAIEGQTALDNFDIFAEAGGKGIVLERAFIVNVTDGQLEVRFTEGSGAADTKPIVTALSVVGSGYRGSPTTPPDGDPPATQEPPAPTPTPSNPDPSEQPITHRPANPNASVAAQEVLSYLYALPSRSDNRVISGQFGSYGDGATVNHAWTRINNLYSQSGKYAALTGMDYRNWDMDHGNNLSEANRFLIDYWNQGGLVTLSWHATNPWTGGSSTDTRGVTSLTDLTTPGRPGYDRWMRQLNDIASGLQELENAGVVVIWRPLHEMNGGWFWWGFRDASEYHALWRHMYNYFTYQKGLTNLLWAWSPNYAIGEGSANLLNWYPGHGYVDIVGMDKYRKLEENGLELNAWGTYDKLVSIGKPVALLEFGPTPASSWPDRPDWDYGQLIQTIRTKYPRIVLFQAWEWHWAIPEHNNANGLMNDSWVVDRSELPRWSN